MGLTDEEVMLNRKKYGNNDITIKNKNSFFKLLIESLGDPIIKILLIALSIKTIFLIKNFDWYETVGIVITIFIASFVSSISEYGSEKAFERLKEESLKLKCKVLRNNSIKEINITDVVKNDLIILNSGDRIPADGVVIKGSITVDESALTGETIEKVKNINDKLFRGSVVYANECTMLVKEVGKSTIYGKTIDELSEKSPISPLKKRLLILAKQLSKIGYISAILVALAYLFSVIVIQNNFNIELILKMVTNFRLLSSHILYAMTISVTIIVVAVPEGLPMMITLVLSSNMRKLLKNNVLVRKLVGIETAGNINILFTDKTGTLTKGNLYVTDIIDGGYNEYKSLDNMTDNYRDIVLKSMICNNNCSFANNKIIGGNSTDKAIFLFTKGYKCKYKKISTVPFDSSKKYMITTIDKNTRLIKGAPEIIIKNCNFYYNFKGEKVRWYKKMKYCDYIDELTKKGYRIIALAINDSYVLDDFYNLIFVGIILIKDEVREEAKEGIKLMKEAGVNTIMITGDNKGTALEIASELNMLEEDSITLTSDELNNITDEDLSKVISKLKIVARALPQDKSRLVKVAQKNNYIVGMTGDGVNDAPALKKANVGFSMGSGTEVAKEASDIIINDDNFISIAKAILFGRTIFKNIRKFIIFQLTINFCAIFLSVTGPFIGINTPITVIQMLWVNMVMDTLAGLAFSYEPPLIEYMKEKPKKSNEPILNKYMLNQIIVIGLYSSILSILFLKTDVFKIIFKNNISFMTAFFSLFIFLGVANSFNTRTTRLNVFDNIIKNKMFLFIIMLIVLIQVLLIYFGGSIFRTYPLKINELILIIILSLTVIPVDLIRKTYFKKRYDTSL